MDAIDSRSIAARRGKPRVRLLLALLALLAPALAAQSSAELQWISWEAVDGAGQYRVEVRRAGASDVILQAFTAENSLVLKLGSGSYEFQVTVYNRFKKEAGSTGWKPLTVLRTAVPRIDSWSSEALIAGTEQVLEIRGENFLKDSRFLLAKGAISIKGAVISIDSEATAKVRFSLAGAEAGLYHVVAVNPPDLRSEAPVLAELLDRKAPTVESLSLTELLGSASAEGVIVRGEAFERGSACYLEDVETGRRTKLAAVFRSAKELGVDYPAGLPAGTYRLVVANPGGLEARAERTVLVADAGLPAYRSVSRGNFLGSESRAGIVVEGAGFTAGTEAWLAAGAKRYGIEKEADPTEGLFVGWFDAGAVPPGEYELVLSNGGAKVLKTGAKIVINAPGGFAVTGGSPDTVEVGSGALEIAVEGRGFGAGMTAEMPGQKAILSVMVDSALKARVALDASALAPGFYDIAFTNAAGEKSVLRRALYVKEKPVVVEVPAPSGSGTSASDGTASSGTAAASGATAPSGGTAAAGTSAPTGEAAASGATAPSGETAAAGTSAPTGEAAASGATDPSSGTAGAGTNAPTGEAAAGAPGGTAEAAKPAPRVARASRLSADTGRMETITLMSWSYFLVNTAYASITADSELFPYGGLGFSLKYLSYASPTPPAAPPSYQLMSVEYLPATILAEVKLPLDADSALALRGEFGLFVSSSVFANSLPTARYRVDAGWVLGASLVFDTGRAFALGTRFSVDWMGFYPFTNQDPSLAATGELMPYVQQFLGAKFSITIGL